MKKQIVLQKQICKTQIIGAVTGILSTLLSVLFSCLLWLEHQYHPAVIILLCLGLWVILLYLNYLIICLINKTLYKKLEKHISFNINLNKFNEILTEVQENGVFNLTHQNYFLFSKSTIDNVAFYDVNRISTSQELKGLHTNNINNLRKAFPDIKNKYLSDNHLRMDARVFVVDKIPSFLYEYILLNNSKLAEIGKIRCVIEISTHQVIMPTLLPRGVDILGSMLYLKLLNFFENKM